MTTDKRGYAKMLHICQQWFANPYEQLGYVNHDTSGYIQKHGFDPNFPFAQLPTAITGSTTPTQYYGDYYYQDVGKELPLRWSWPLPLLRAFLLVLEACLRPACRWRAASKNLFRGLGTLVPIGYEVCLPTSVVTGTIPLMQGFSTGT